MADEMDEFVGEPDEWTAMTRRNDGRNRLSFYLAMKGALDPEPDSQSPFEFEETERAFPPLWRPGNTRGDASGGRVARPGDIRWRKCRIG